jgi:hypothetical protein
MIYIFTTVTKGLKIRDIAFDIATGYGLDVLGIGVRASVLSRFLSSPRCLDLFWGLRSLLSNGDRDLFSQG